VSHKSRTPLRSALIHKKERAGTPAAWRDLSNINPSLKLWQQSATQRGYERETFEGSTQLLPELEIFGWLRFHTTLSGALTPDRHPDAFEFHYMVRGHLNWEVAGEHHEFSTGQVFIIRPNELHGGDEGSIQPCEHYWLRLQFPEKGSLPGMTQAETAELREGYEHLKYRVFTASREVGEFFERLLEEHRHGKTALSQPMSRAMLHALLITIQRDHNRYCQATKNKPLVSWRVRRTIDWLEKQICLPEVRLESAAANVGLSPAGLRARFKAETGYTVHQYLLQRRIVEARRRLAETKQDITAIAHSLGFSSSQYFATTFRHQVGVAPGTYRKGHHKSAATAAGK
jgi:AraC family transcriptional regulator, L-rhamnose operon regulatory protein RhaS